MSAAAEQIRAIAEQVTLQAARWEVLAVDRAETVVELGDGVLDAVRSAREEMVCLRIEVDGRLGTATTTAIDDDADVLVQEALAATRYGPPVGPALPPPPADPGSPPTGSQDVDQGSDLAAADTDGLAGLAAQLATEQQRTGLRVHGRLTRVVEHVHRAGPGRSCGERHSYWHTSVVAEGRADQGLQLPWTAWTAEPGIPGELRRWLADVAGWEHLAEVPVDEPTELLLAPPAVHAVLTPLIGALSGTAVAAGRSFVADRLGGHLLHPALSIVDGPTARSDEAASGLVWPSSDDEGVPCRASRLVEGGAPVRLYHSLASAAAMRAAPTGHGFRGNALRRSLLRPVAPVINGLGLDVASDRSAPLRDLINDTTDGILVESLLGTAQRGALSPVVQGRVRLGFVIRGGRVVGRLPNVPVAIDLFDVLGSALLGVSHERWPMSRIWTGVLPFVRVHTRAGGREGSLCTT